MPRQAMQEDSENINKSTNLSFGITRLLKWKQEKTQTQGCGGGGNENQIGNFKHYFPYIHGLWSLHESRPWCCPSSSLHQNPRPIPFFSLIRCSGFHIHMTAKFLSRKGFYFLVV